MPHIDSRGHVHLQYIRCEVYGVDYRNKLSFVFISSNDIDAECWSQDDADDLLVCAGYPGLIRRAQKRPEDTISQMSMDSTDSREPVFVAAGDIRRRLSEVCLREGGGGFAGAGAAGSGSSAGFRTRDPEDPSASVLKEPWEDKVPQDNLSV